MDGYREKYGMLWPEALPDPLIDLKVWKHWREPEYKACTEKEPWECFWRAIYSLIPRKEFVRHEWSEQHVHDWTAERFIITWGCASASKAQPLDSTVLTPFGPRRMADVSIGDRVISQDGKTSAVIQTHDVGEQDEYEVELQDGTRAFCAGSHLWEVGFRAGDRARNRVVTTEWIAAQNRPSDLYVPLCAPVYFEKRPAKIPHYLMGALLGDGCFSINGQLRLSATDPDIIESARACLASDYELRSVSRGDFMIVKRSRVRGAENKYIRALADYGLLGTKSGSKFIPDDYLYAERRSREELLAGLMDTDGSIGKSQALSYTSVSMRLARGVQFLVQSLGGIASISTHPASYRNKSGVLTECQPAHTVFFRLPGDNSFIFKSRRKKARLRAARRGVRGRYIVAARKTGRRVPMKCITTDHPRGLYLTNDCIVTHNSNDYGLLTLIDWMVDPNETVAIMASTSLQMLKLRSYESVLRYFHVVKANRQFDMPGKLRKTDSAIILDDDDDIGASTDKASIRGVAVAEGTEQEARAKLQGAHLPYVRLILDELSQMRPAAMRVRTNLSIGSKDFKLVGLCNPDSFTDLAAQYSKPDLPGGFAAIDPETTHEWSSPYGKVRRHDGLLSPAILHPERKDLGFLLTQEKLDTIRHEIGGGDDDPEFWTMVRGFPPAQGRKQTLLSMAEFMRSGATEDVTWRLGPSVTVLGCDPAFSEGGNRAVMQALSAGFDKDGLLKILCHEPKYAKIEASSQVPITDQVGAALKDYADLLQVPAHLVGVDDSATQSVADHMKSKYGWTVHRFVSNAKPSDLPMVRGLARKASDQYYNQSTELWAATAEFVRAGQMRAFPMVAAEQLCQRPLEPNKRPHRLLSKKTSIRDGGEMKSGDSPDEQDAMSIAVGVLRFVLNLIAGADTIPEKYLGPWGSAAPKVFGSGLRQAARKYDLDARAYEHAGA